jgi:predicted RNA polymerase sigma factor
MGDEPYLTKMRESTETLDRELRRLDDALPAVRGDLLAKLGRRAEARVELERAASPTHDACERDVLLERMARC